MSRRLLQHRPRRLSILSEATPTTSAKDTTSDSASTSVEDASVTDTLNPTDKDRPEEKAHCNWAFSTLQALVIPSIISIALLMTEYMNNVTVSSAQEKPNGNSQSPSSANEYAFPYSSSYKQH